MFLSRFCQNRDLPHLRLAFAFAVLLTTATTTRADDWPQWLGPQRDGVWRETNIRETLPTNGLTVRWRTPLGGGYSGPAVAHGRVYVMDRQRDPGGKLPGNAFARSEIPGAERIVCLDESDGHLLWEQKYDATYTISYAAGPRTTPAVADGRVFTLGAEGQFHCLNATNGAIHWSKDFRKEFGIKTPMWGFSSHPLVDGQQVICLAGGTGSVAVAYDVVTGRERWRALSAKEPGYAPPMIYTFGQTRQLIIWHPESVNALEPETGKLIWTYALSPTVRFGMTIPSPRQIGDKLFLTSFYNGSLLLKVGTNGATPIWQSRKVSEMDTDGLHCVMATPWIEDGFIYGPCSYGQFRCLQLDTGDRRWETFAPTSGKSARWGNAFVVKQGNRAILFSELGDLIFARLTPDRYEEISRTHLLEPDNHDPGRPVVWSHPAFANRCIFARNDHEIICAPLAKP